MWYIIGDSEAPQTTNYNQQQTFGKFIPKAAIMAIVEEQTNAEELDSPEPVWTIDIAYWI